MELAHPAEAVLLAGLLREVLDRRVVRLGLDNSIARSRTLISATAAAAKLLETGELEAGLANLELVIASARMGDARERSDRGLLDE